jgi:hypothetical protein
MSVFQGLPTRTLNNGLVSLEYLADAGPRIVRLSAFGKDNLFADIPTTVNTPCGDFFFRAGIAFGLLPRQCHAHISLIMMALPLKN